MMASPCATSLRPGTRASSAPSGSRNSAPPASPPALIDSDKHPLQGDVTAPFVYLRLQRNAAGEALGYAEAALDGWVTRVQRWTAGKAVDDLPLSGELATAAARDCFVFFISGDKVRAPDAAQAFIARCATGRPDRRS